LRPNRPDGPPHIRLAMATVQTAGRRSGSSNCPVQESGCNILESIYCANIVGLGEAVHFKRRYKYNIALTSTGIVQILYKIVLLLYCGPLRALYIAHCRPTRAYKRPTILVGYIILYL
jgi:hypothetical protein